MEPEERGIVMKEGTKMMTENHSAATGNETDVSRGENGPKGLTFSYFRGPSLPSKKYTEEQMVGQIRQGIFDDVLAKEIAAFKISIKSNNCLGVVDVGISAGDKVPECKFIASIILTPGMGSSQDLVWRAAKNHFEKNYLEMEIVVRSFAEGESVMLVTGGLHSMDLKQLRKTFEGFIKEYEEASPA
jgi:hypothetical protein